jgi:hypothetical protein
MRVYDPEEKGRTTTKGIVLGRGVARGRRVLLCLLGVGGVHAAVCRRMVARSGRWGPKNRVDNGRSPRARTLSLSIQPRLYIELFIDPHPSLRSFTHTVSLLCIRPFPFLTSASIPLVIIHTVCCCTVSVMRMRAL